MPASTALRWSAAALISFLVLFNIALISLEIASVPIRGMLAVAALGALGVVKPDLLAQAIARHLLILLLAGVLAALGIFVSLVNGASIWIIGRMLLEVHVQAVVTLLLATMLAAIAGPRAAVIAFCAAIAVTAAVAAVQYAGLELGWSLREILGNLQGHDFAEDSSFQNRRPMGLSYSPIHLATQACLAFAAFAALRLWTARQHGNRLSIDWAILLAVAVLAGVSILSGTRSPVLGAALFVMIYALLRGTPFSSLAVVVAAICLLIAAPFIIELMENAQNRAFRIGDNSFSGRLPLILFGLRLFAENPLGYGFGFVSSDYWASHWQVLYTLPSAGVVREAELHNYALNMLTTYGVGLLLAAPLVGLLLWRGRALLMAFVPYGVHLVFHNSGPFWNDTLFWFVIGALSTMQLAGSSEAGRKSNRPQRRWRQRRRAPA